MLQQSALLVTLQISQWTARKLDKEITKEVHDTHNAQADAGRYNKLLISKEHLQPIVKIAGEARQYHYKNTLPWGTNGEGILSAEAYLDYLQQMMIFRDSFNAAVQVLLDKRDEIVAEARIRLNGMFKESDYPSRRKMFGE